VLTVYSLKFAFHEKKKKMTQGWVVYGGMRHAEPQREMFPRSYFMRKTFLLHQSSHSRSRQVKHAQNKYNSDKYPLKWQYVCEAARYLMGCATQTLFIMPDLLGSNSTNPLFLPIRDRDKYNIHNKNYF
jgi:hypothetical protein